MSLSECGGWHFTQIRYFPFGIFRDYSKYLGKKANKKINFRRKKLEISGKVANFAM